MNQAKLKRKKNGNTESNCFTESNCLCSRNSFLLTTVNIFFHFKDFLETFRFFTFGSLDFSAFMPEIEPVNGFEQ